MNRRSWSGRLFEDLSRIWPALTRAGVCAGLAAAAFAVLDSMPPGAAAQLLAALVLLSPPAVVVFLTSRTATLSRGSDRVFWRAASNGALALLVGEGCDLLWRVAPSTLTALVLGLQLVSFVVAAVFGAVAAHASVGDPDVTAHDAIGYSLDILVIFFAVFALVLTLTLPALRSDPRVGYVRGVMIALYPSLALALVVYVAVFKRSAWHRWEVLTVAWLGLLGVKHLGAVTLPLAARLVPAGVGAMLPIDVMLVFAYALVGAAAWDRARSPSTVSAPAVHTPGPIWPSLVTPAALILLAPMIYVRLSTPAWSEEDVWIIVALGVAIGLATTARSYVLAKENTSLRWQSVTDPLTGLFNHRYFQERLGAELARAERAGSPLAVAMMDVDDFDRVNNVYGHAIGDRRLRSISGKLVETSRGADVVCRIGGDEFAILMPDTDAIESCKVCLRLQDRLHEPDGVCPLPTLVSTGIAGVPEHARTREELIQRADGALYWAKYHGREQVVIYDPDLVRSLGPEERIAKLEAESYLNMVQLLSSAVDARDPYTERHSRRVAETAVALALDIGLDEERAALIETAALLHDVGKIGVPDAVLRKPDVLTFEERELVKEHPLLATRILGAIPHPEILPWIAAHHERWDGDGYPAGLRGRRSRWRAASSLWPTLSTR